MSAWALKQRGSKSQPTLQQTFSCSFAIGFMQGRELNDYASILNYGLRSTMTTFGHERLRLLSREALK